MAEAMVSMSFEDVTHLVAKQTAKSLLTEDLCSQIMRFKLKIPENISEVDVRANIKDAFNAYDLCIVVNDNIAIISLPKGSSALSDWVQSVHVTKKKTIKKINRKIETQQTQQNDAFFNT